MTAAGAGMRRIKHASEEILTGEFKGCNDKECRYCSLLR